LLLLSSSSLTGSPRPPANAAAERTSVERELTVVCTICSGICLERRAATVLAADDLGETGQRAAAR